MPAPLATKTRPTGTRGRILMRRKKAAPKVIELTTTAARIERDAMPVMNGPDDRLPSQKTCRLVVASGPATGRNPIVLTTKDI